MSGDFLFADSGYVNLDFVRECLELVLCFVSTQVTVNTNIIDLNEYLQHILKSTNMRCLTPEKVQYPLDENSK